MAATYGNAQTIMIPSAMVAGPLIEVAAQP
jgi:hypothetical protein